MAKTSKRGEKSAAVRELLAANPRMKTRQIVETLKARGISIRPNMVYVIKSHDKRRRRRRAVRAAAFQAGTSPVNLVLKVKELASQAGGLRQLKQLVDALAE